MFKIGDCVYMNPKYMGKVDIVRGYITPNTQDYDPKSYIIDWEDGSKGSVRLDVDEGFILLV